MSLRFNIKEKFRKKKKVCYSLRFYSSNMLHNLSLKKKKKKEYVIRNSEIYIQFELLQSLFEVSWNLLLWMINFIVTQPEHIQAISCMC